MTAGVNPIIIPSFLTAADIAQSAVAPIRPLMSRYSQFFQDEHDLAEG